MSKVASEVAYLSLALKAPPLPEAPMLAQRLGFSLVLAAVDMTQRLIGPYRCPGLGYVSPLAAGAGLAAASWSDKQPVRPKAVTHHSPAMRFLGPNRHRRRSV